MAVKDKKDIKETAAADSLKPGSMTGSKSETMAKLFQLINAMSLEDMSAKLDPILQGINADKSEIPDGAAAHNRSTIAATGMKEDIDRMFGEELNEELKEKATVLFEAAVSARVQMEVATIKEATDKALTEQVETQMKKLAEAVDTYVAHAADQWLEENEVAVNNTLKVEIMEEFIDSMKETFAKHYVNVPDAKVDLVDELVKKSEELEARVNELVRNNIELKTSLQKHDSEAVFGEAVKGLSETQKEKFRALTENIAFKDSADFTKKLKVIKEAYFSDKKGSKSGIINEDAGVKDPKEVAEEGKTQKIEEVDPVVQAVFNAMSKTAK